MIQITCGICEDLMPLVQDGIASEDIRQALRRHIESCPSCQAMFQGELPPSDGQDILGQDAFWGLQGQHEEGLIITLIQLQAAG